MTATQQYFENERHPLYFPTSIRRQRPARHSMVARFFLVLSRKGADRITQTPPRLNAGEIAVKVQFMAPDALFQAPLLQASITIPDSIVSAEPLSAEVQDNVRELIQQATGMEVRLILEPQTAAE